MATELDRAWDASSKASDSGAIAFGEHRDYPRAIRDNKAAQAAWKRVESQAAKSFDSGLALDARARVGELEVAMGMLKSDMAAHMQFSQPLLKRGWFGPLPTGTAAPNGQPTTSGGKSKVALLAAGALVLAKLAHLF